MTIRTNTTQIEYSGPIYLDIRLGTLDGEQENYHNIHDECFVTAFINY